MDVQDATIHQLITTLKRRIRATQGSTFDLEAFCTEPTTGKLFAEQYAFIRDPSKYRLACNSRRSGKTTACAGDLVATAQNFPGTPSAYFTLSRLNAKQIIWRELLDINRRYRLGGKPNETELTLQFENGSLIYLFGAKDETEIEKARGKAYKKVYIDEAQAFKPYLKRLIDDIISPALIDHNGSLALIGTPPPVKAGTFYEAFHKMPGFTDWSVHHWTMFNNPFLAAKAGVDPMQIVVKDCAAKGIDIKDPWVRREYFGEWVEDGNSLVYQYDALRNGYDTLPDIAWRYVLGIDVGFDDPDALVVWAYSEESPFLYLVEEFQCAKQTISDLAAHIKRLEKTYPFSKKVMDSGGLGKKAMQELRARYGMAIESAEKTEKAAYIELMNDDFRRGLIKVKPHFQITQDWRVLSWDRDHTPPIEDSRFANHLSDAALYAWREAKHFAYKPKPVKSVDPDSQIMQYWGRVADRSQQKEWWESDT